MRRTERHDPRKARKTPEASSTSVSPDANLEEQRVTRSRGQSSTGSTSTLDFAHDSYPDTDGGNSTNRGADIFPFDEHMTFGDSLDPFALPEMASNLPTLAQPSTQDTTEAILHRFTSGNTCLLLEPAANHGASARRDTPLHMAVRNGSGKIVQLLLQYGADCNARDSKGMTPLAHAIVENHDSVADILLSHGAQMAEMDDQQRSALHLAVLHRHEQLLRILVRNCPRNNANAVLDGYDMQGKTPLHLAVSMELASAVEILCEAGANVHLQPGGGSDAVE